MTRWYRAYEGTVTDAKLAEVALVAECSRSVAIAAWHCILESAAKVNEAGRFDTTARRVAVILGEPPQSIERIISAMAEIDMIADNVVVAWTRRQYESDSSTERSRLHRQRKGNRNATLQPVAPTSRGRRATPPTTDSDSETDSDTNTELDVVVDDTRAIVGADFEQMVYIEALDPDGTPTFARECAEAAGVRMASPTAVATVIDLTRIWLADGATQDEILTCIKHGVANAPEPIHSMRYFDASIRQAVARRRNGVSPTLRRPSGRPSAWTTPDAEWM